ncbi:outer membrane protein assembly factor BamE [Colwellia psychrerythraea]|uniref:Outer membrane protein assembly factor BamE n=1 Tax=Colwellia psychrerythraea (strain 34H / ATCC BAA-681) TaxID=167879 RepID=Q47XI1_COLP3|nr:outer membrane protein assembly factor BamE [Colwellia psychrerythraea]AAZ28800.1 SmpA/OmlA family protein [Colwellia psychrerythraea 34H]
MYFRVAIVITALTLSACSSWVFRYDVPQGNYLEQKSIDKLQVGMTKEQVKFILGSPVVVDAFNNDTWNYVYKLKSGRSKDFDMKKQFIINFSNDKLVSASGDFEVSDNFNTPFNAPVVETEAANDTELNEEAKAVVKSKTINGK